MTAWILTHPQILLPAAVVLLCAVNGIFDLIDWIQTRDTRRKWWEH